MKIITIFFSFLFLLTTGNTFGQSGEELFKQKCAACHTVGKGKLVGPDLSGVTKRLEEPWLLKFITSSQAVINSGDDYAKKKFEEFNKVIMPDPGLKETEIKSILTFIESQGTSTTQTVSNIRPLKDASPDNIEKGKKLFSGEFNMTNNGTPCVSCHNVPGATILGGGNLALDLTNAYTKLSEAGLTSMIQTQPFPVMKQAFFNAPITDEEVFNIASYLKDVDEKNKYTQQTNEPMNLLYSGVGGLLVLIALITGFWRNRKKFSVNHEIYKRQEDYIKKNS